MEATYRRSARKIIMKEEAFEPLPYLDSKGIPTIGYGTVIGVKGTPLSCYKLTVTENSASALLDDDMVSTCDKLDKLDWFANLNIARKSILTSCAYQTGYNGLLKFHHMVSAIRSGDYDKAAAEMLDSQVAKITAPARWKRAAEVMKTGLLSSSYDEFKAGAI